MIEPATSSADSIHPNQRVSVPETPPLILMMAKAMFTTNQSARGARRLQIGRGRLRMRRRFHRMSKTIKAIVYERHGNPAEVLQIRPSRAPSPPLMKQSLRCARRRSSGGHQCDRRKYPGRREVPAMPGFEGAGVVSESARTFQRFAKGALVILPHNIGTWREAICGKASELVAVPPEIEPVHAAMLKSIR